MNYDNKTDKEIKRIRITLEAIAEVIAEANERERAKLYEESIRGEQSD